MVHPELTGNKFFKLRYNLAEAQEKGMRQILTFGGAFSNHIYATAAAGSLYNFDTIGVIRGEVVRPLNPTLQASADFGMSFYPLDRSTYRKKEQSEILDKLAILFGPSYIIPEGGTNALAIKGCRDILTPPCLEATHIAVGVGTGGTLAGIVSSAAQHQEVLGFSALKGEFMKTEIEQLLKAHKIRPKGNVTMVTNYHFGGYAKHTQELINFMRDFYRQTGIPLDPVYTGKMMYGVFDMLHNDYFPRHSKILIVHSGGLQGIKGFEAKLGITLYP